MVVIIGGDISFNTACDDDDGGVVVIHRILVLARAITKLVCAVMEPADMVV